MTLLYLPVDYILLCTLVGDWRNTHWGMWKSLGGVMVFCCCLLFCALADTKLAASHPLWLKHVSTVPEIICSYIRSPSLFTVKITVVWVSVQYDFHMQFLLDILRYISYINYFVFLLQYLALKH